MSLPLLGMLGVLLLLGWKLGPWLPLSITLATAIGLALSWRLGRPPRQIEGDSAAVRRWREHRVNKVGHWFAAITVGWLALSIILLVVILIAALLAR